MPAPRKPLKLPVKVIILFGSLQHVLTPFLERLTALKPNDQVWSFLINRTSEDQEIVASTNTEGSTTNGEDVIVRQLAGCICCSTDSVTVASILQLIRSTKPDLLFIKPSAVAKPAQLLESLTSENLNKALSIRSIVQLIDLSTFIIPKDDDTENNEQAQLVTTVLGILPTDDKKLAVSTEELSRWAASVEQQQDAGGSSSPPRQVCCKRIAELTLEDIGIQ